MLVEATIGRRISTVFSPLNKIVALDATASAEGFAFTSSNGVAQASRLGITGGVAWCVGDRTAQIAREAGFDAKSAAGNVEDLLECITKDKPRIRLAHIRGYDSVGSLAQRLNERGISCEDVVAYAQKPLPIALHVVELIKGEAPVVIPLFSPKATERLFQSVKPGSGAVLIAISKAASMSYEMQIAERPDGQSMLNATVTALNALSV